MRRRRQERARSSSVITSHTLYTMSKRKATVPAAAPDPQRGGLHKFFGVAQKPKPKPPAPVPAPAGAASSSNDLSLSDEEFMAIDVDAAIAQSRQQPSATPPPRPPPGPLRQPQLNMFRQPPQMPPPPPAMMHAPNPADANDTHILRHQFDRFNATAADAAQQPAAPAAPLNAAQRLVAEHPPDQPLSVRAGAGTGKTHTMMQRAVHLVNVGVAPRGILMLTFSNRAAAELKERLGTAFPALPDGFAQRPAANTFHSLAFRWIGMYWKLLNLGCHPKPLTGTAGARTLMGRVLDEMVDDERLKRCREWMGSRLSSSESAPWSEILDVFRAEKPDEYARALKAAEDEVPFDDKPDEKKAKPADEKKRKRGAAKAEKEAAKEAKAAAEKAEAKALEEAKAELERVRHVALCRHVYFELQAIVGRKKPLPPYAARRRCRRPLRRMMICIRNGLSQRRRREM